MQDVINSIEIPDYTISKGNKKEAYKRINGKILKIVYMIKEKYIKVITVIWK